MDLVWILGIVIGAVVLIVAAYFIFFHRKVQCLVSVKKVEKNFEKLKGNQIEQKLSKIATISESNENFVEIYNSLKDRYMNLSIDMIAKTEGDILRLKILIEEGNYKLSKAEIKLTANTVNDLAKKYENLEKDIDKINKEEEELREKLVPVKERLRKLKADFFSSKEEFSECKDVFEGYITNLETTMVDLEEKLNTGFYKEANEMIENLGKDVDFYAGHLERLPKLISFSLQVLPKRLNESLDTYEKLKEEGYPLYNIKVSAIEKEIKETLEEIKTRFEELKYDGVEKDIKAVALKIEKINEGLQKEKSAKEDFDNNIDKTYEKFALVSKKIIKAKRDGQNISGFFYLDEIYQEKLILLENRLHVVDRIKADLDGYIHSITKQPYSMLASKMNELYEYSSEIDEQLNQYISYIESLGIDSQKAYDDVNKYSIAVHEEYNKIRLLNHEVLNEKFKKGVESIFKNIDEINTMLSTRPINVEILNNRMNNFTVSANNLLKEMKESESLFKLAQNIIVFTNKYRTSFTDVDDVLNSAEIHFENGEFEFAIDEVSDLLQNVHPKAYEEMMKRKDVKDE